MFSFYFVIIQLHLYSSSIAKLQQPYSKCFKVTTTQTSCRVEYLDSFWTQFIFNTIVPRHQVYTFKIKITKTQNRLIMIGIIDEPKRIKNPYSYDSNDIVSYYGHNCSKNPSGGHEGVGFREGQTVETEVDLESKTVRWRVDGEIRATHSHQILGDQSRTFRPFIEMAGTNDIVEFLL